MVSKLWSELLLEKAMANFLKEETNVRPRDWNRWQYQGTWNMSLSKTLTEVRPHCVPQPPTASALGTERDR
jgi:hypothetical protein